MRSHFLLYFINRFNRLKRENETNANDWMHLFSAHCHTPQPSQFER